MLEIIVEGKRIKKKLKGFKKGKYTLEFLAKTNDILKVALSDYRNPVYKMIISFSPEEQENMIYKKSRLFETRIMDAKKELDSVTNTLPVYYRQDVLDKTRKRNWRSLLF